MDCLTGIKDM